MLRPDVGAGSERRRLHGAAVDLAALPFPFLCPPPTLALKAVGRRLPWARRARRKRDDIYHLLDRTFYLTPETERSF